MFRELTRKNQALTMEECVQILNTQTRGVLAVNGDDGYPYAMPMNHWYNEADGKIYFHCGKVGHRLDALKRDARVSFCVYDRGERESGQWALKVKSVVVFGKIAIVDEMDRIVDVSRKLSYKFTRDDAYIDNEIAKYAPATLLLELTVEHICGKRVTES